MLVGIIVNSLLVYLGYYLGLRSSKKRWEHYLNESVELREAFAVYLSEIKEPIKNDPKLKRVVKAVKEALKEDTAPVKTGATVKEVEINNEDVKAPAARVYKEFNFDPVKIKSKVLK